MKYLIKRLARCALHKELREASTRHHEVRGLLLEINRQLISANQHPKIDKAMNRLQVIFDIKPEELLDTPDAE